MFLYFVWRLLYFGLCIQLWPDQCLQCRCEWCATACAGTAKQHVAFDYAKRLAKGQTETEAVAGDALNVLLTRPGAAPLPWQFCRRLNETVCAASQQLPAAAGSSATLAVYNQLGQVRTELVLLPVASPNVIVRDGSSGQALPVQVYQAGETLTNYARNTGEAAFVAAFQATLPPAGVATYQVPRGAGGTWAHVHDAKW